MALLLVFAALGKSAQVPFSGWLPQAMEGPTPSSAIFYGALSIHAGAYVLLRCEAVLDADGERIPAQDLYVVTLSNGYSFAARGSGTQALILAGLGAVIWIAAVIIARRRMGATE